MTHSPTLFSTDDESDLDDALRAEPGTQSTAANGPFAGVALDQSIDRLLDYSIPKRLAHALQIGQRVVVPLGRNNRAARGYVVSIESTTSHTNVKPIRAIDDERVLVSPSMMTLARWVSRYYVAPLGTVIEAIVPAAVKKKTGIGYTSIVRPLKSHAELQAALEATKAPKRRSVIARLLQLEEGKSIELTRLAGEAGVKPATARKLVALGLISIQSEADVPGFAESMSTQIIETAGTVEADIQVNADQQKVLDEIFPRLATGTFNVNLLLGVTGSGKTEIYLRCIREVLATGRQAIVLVPEIALTLQTVRRFAARFGRVAILHSGLTATQRHRFWQQVASGQADVVIGARSAVFAPLPKLGIIIVDEEHESTYKSDNAPRYNARDVAIKRAQLEGATVILGSATPSLESWHRTDTSRLSSDARLSPYAGGGEERGGGGADLANRQRVADTASPLTQPLPGYRERREGAASDCEPLVESASSASPPPPEYGERSKSSYHLLHLPHRVRGLALPHVELVDLRNERKFRRGVHLLSQRLEALLRHTVDSGHQAILLLNRRGYSNFVVCNSCGEVIHCKYCDTTMTYHRTAGERPMTAKLSAGLHSGQLHCHYCLAIRPLPEKCDVCGKKLSLFGLGTQRVEEEIAKKFPDLRFARVDSDSMRGTRDYEPTLAKFASGETQMLLGTQMLAKGLDYPNVTLVGVISGDTALSLPDFRASERTMQLITQVAGRAGRGDSPGRVVVQTFLPDDPAIQFAIKQDFVGFARSELPHRKEIGLPPFSRMARIVVRDEDAEKANAAAEKLAAKLSEAIGVAQQVRLRGPMPCAISRIAGFFRVQIELVAATAGPLQKVLAAVRGTGGLSKNDRIAVDVDPVSLL